MATKEEKETRWTVLSDKGGFVVRAPPGRDGSFLTVAEVTELIHALTDARAEYLDHRIPCAVRDVDDHDASCSACGGSGYVTRAQMLRRMPSAPPSAPKETSS